MRDLSQHLASWLESGGGEAGEVVIVKAGHGFELCHRADLGRGGLVARDGADVAREIANLDDAGNYRPLKTAPNLRRGWKLRVPGLAELRRALDYLYPAMLGVWRSQTRGELRPVPLRETLGRQTGLYRVTQKISEEEAQTIIGDFCRSNGGCLKHILWPIAPGHPVRTLPDEKLRVPAAGRALPLLCHEACNLLVAQVRTVVKKVEVQS